MEELKMIVDMVAKLPQMALWVLIGIWAYKVAVVGSIYGVIRFITEKTHSYLVTRKTAPLEVKAVELRPVLDGMVITGELDALVAQLHRVRLHVNGTSALTYMHNNSVEWLRQAIDEKITKETAEAYNKAAAAK